MVVFVQKWLYSGKCGCIRERGCSRAKVIVFLQSGCNRQSSCNRAEVVVFGISDCIRAKKWLCSGKVVVNVQSGCIRAKMVVFGQG